MLSRRILVAPLDWGLGHATRCVPVIRELLALGQEVILGGAGDALQLLQQEFPRCDTLNLPAYNVRYSSEHTLLSSLLMQAPRLFLVIRKEHAILSACLDKMHIDAVISDNRYGLWSGRVPSVLITHQLHLPAPSWLRAAANAVNRYFISRFAECWVPDYADEPGLAGHLSHPPLEGIHTYYIGPLSRFQKKQFMPARYDVTVILSGPEPQRTVFENLVMSQAKALSLRTFVVRGKPGMKPQDQPGNTAAHLGAQEMEKLLCETEYVVSRSGYSSIMDYHALGRKAILVPTPGQPEQEYLANFFREKKMFYTVSQEAFNMKYALLESKSCTTPEQSSPSILRSHLNKWIDHILTSTNTN